MKKKKKVIGSMVNVRYMMELKREQCLLFVDRIVAGYKASDSVALEEDMIQPMMERLGNRGVELLNSLANKEMVMSVVVNKAGVHSVGMMMMMNKKKKVEGVHLMD